MSQYTISPRSYDASDTKRSSNFEMDLAASGIQNSKTDKSSVMQRNICNVPGIYTMQLLSAQKHTSRKGTPGVIYTFKFIGGAFDGATHISFDRHDPNFTTLSGEKIPNFFMFRNLRALGMPEEAIANGDVLAGLDALTASKLTYRVQLNAVARWNNDLNQMETFLNPDILGSVKSAPLTPVVIAEASKSAAR